MVLTDLLSRIPSNDAPVTWFIYYAFDIEIEVKLTEIY